MKPVRKQGSNHLLSFVLQQVKLQHSLCEEMDKRIKQGLPCADIEVKFVESQKIARNLLKKI